MIRPRNTRTDLTRPLVFLASLVALLAWPSPAQSTWQYWTGHGLERGAVRIFEDHRGTLWFSTYLNGLVWYDGANWGRLTTNDGLADNYVTSMFEDRSGSLWFGNGSQGVLKYDGSGWRTFTTADGLASNYVTCMLQDRNGSLWFGHEFGGGATRYDGVNWRTFGASDGLAGLAVLSMLEDRNGVLWFATYYGGVSRFDGTSWRTYTTADGLVDDTVYSIVEDRDGALWFAAFGGISRFDGSTWRTYAASDSGPPFFATSATKDRDGNIWFATSIGAIRFDGAVWDTLTAADGLTRDDVGFMLVDRSGGLCFVSGAGDVSRFDGATWRKFGEADGLANHYVFSSLVDRDGALWFGTLRGVSRFDGWGWRTFTINDGLSSDYVGSLLQDRTGPLWAATNIGMDAFNGTTWAWLPGLPGGVRCTFVDRNGAWWLGTTNGVYRRSGSVLTHYTTANGLAGNWVTCIVQANDRALWIGTQNGLSRFDGTSWRTYTSADGLAADNVSSGLKDRAGVLWFGSGDAVSRFDGSSWSALTTADGLAGPVTAITQDRDGALWFGTSTGRATRYDGVTLRSFGSAQGFGGPDGPVTSIVEDRKGALWFSTNGVGVIAHDRDRVPPRTVFLYKPAPVSATNIPSIVYRAAFDEQDIEFQFSMNGEPWSEWYASSSWPSRSLPDGSYEFRVRARDYYDNVESPAESLRFEIDATPPSAQILIPAANAAVRDSVTIQGVAADARFAYYRMDYRPRGTSAWTTLADTTRISVTDGRLGDWNTRGLADGAYELRLSVADTLGLVGTVVVPVRVDNHFPYAPQTSPALVIAATGGDVYTDDAAAHLYIPPHGLARDTIVTIAPLDTSAVPAALPGGAQRVSAGYALDWGTVAMAKAATLEFATGGADGAAPVAYMQGADAVWRRIGGTVDPNRERVTLTVDQPGRYALYREGIGVAAPGLARLGAITLTPRVFSPHGTYAASSVAIGFTLGRPGPVTVRVYTRTGRLVQEVAAGLNLGMGANVVRWDGRHRDGRMVEDGEYLVSIATSGEIKTRVLAVVK